MNVWMIGCTHGELDEHMNVWTDGWMAERKD